MSGGRRASLDLSRQQQRPHRLVLAEQRRPVQRRQPIAPKARRVGAVRQEDAHHLGAAVGARRGRRPLQQGGAVGRGRIEGGGATLLQNEVVGEIARRLGRTPAQVLLRWSLQSGFVPLPKSVNEERIRANADVVSWELTADDMAKLAELDCGFRYSIGYRTGHYDVSQPTSRRPARPRLSATQTARRRAQTVRGREPRNPAPAVYSL